MPFALQHVGVEGGDAEAQQAVVVHGQDAMRDGAVHGSGAVAAMRGFDGHCGLAAGHGVRCRFRHRLDDRLHRVLFHP